MTTAVYTHPDCKLHEMGAWHPESPERLQAIEDQLISSRIDQWLDLREIPDVAEADLITAIRRVHSEEAIALVRDHSLALKKSGENYYPLDADTLLNQYSWQAALRAVGAALSATDAVMNGELENAFCSIRPPGHHATHVAPMGFCLFNNIAIAARHAMEVHGLQRVAIVDFDVHHGNGTEEAFLHEPRVLMTSFFQHPFYPFSGTEAAPGNLINLPVPAYSGGDVVRQLAQEKWLPALQAHQPQMIFISAGFDAHREDDMAQMKLVEDDYAWLTAQVMQVAKQYSQGRIVSFLEGGYNLSALGRSVVAHVKVLAGI
ncbi:histone deacetylase family protein [Glaciimonas soli]|uniref:Histone deacetylase family protein n=1 Tax=Glaciimonas soli TaxID=2590999 RepID=A0A843YYH9_9BURK|nr:histone deacetylase family protein [Glaciimonas soli]MQR02528.1 histone deacetylase family protein [Glaciimonas soli]